MLVTGAAGFIGSHIVEDLKIPLALDNFSTSNKYSRDFLINSPAKIFKGDICDQKVLREALDGVSTVYHQAAISSVARSIADPLETNRSNVVGTLTLLKVCAECSVKNVVFASSSGVYGDCKSLPITETVQSSPKSPYAASKIAGEYYADVFHELYGLNCASLRYFNVFGPRQDPKSEYAAVVPKFIRAALSNKPLTIYGDGGQTRDFIYVKDVVLANKSAVGTNGAYNIASGQKTTISGLAEAIIRLTDSKSKIIHGDARLGEIRHSLADISKAKKELSWKPQHSLEKALKLTIDWYSTNM